MFWFDNLKVSNDGIQNLVTNSEKVKKEDEHGQEVEVEEEVTTFKFTIGPNQTAYRILR